MKGKFIVFEGGDGSGKTSLSTYLTDKLREENITAIKTSEPFDSFPIGKMIRKYAKTRKLPPKGMIGIDILNDFLQLGMKDFAFYMSMSLNNHDKTNKITHHLHLADIKHYENKNDDFIDDEIMYHLFMADRYFHLKKIESELNEGKTIICDRYIYSTMVYQNSMIDCINNDYKDILKPDILFFCKSNDDERIFRNRDSSTLDEFEKSITKIRHYNNLYLDVMKNIKDSVDIFYEIETSGTVEETHLIFDEIFNYLEKSLKW